jgi:hypothetical protein
MSVVDNIFDNFFIIMGIVAILFFLLVSVVIWSMNSAYISACEDIGMRYINGGKCIQNDISYRMSFECKGLIDVHCKAYKIYEGQELI